MKLTIDYINAHMGVNENVYREAGKLLSDAILNDAKAYIEKNGPVDRIILQPSISVAANEEGCVTVTYTDGNGNTVSYHRAT